MIIQAFSILFTFKLFKPCLCIQHTLQYIHYDYGHYSFAIAKARRQPKAVKPRKMIRLESKHIVYAACNNGSSAVITKDGDLHIFGKDTSYCDQATGNIFKYSLTLKG